MTYIRTIAQRLRVLLAGTQGLTEKEMFGGIGFMIHGNMACGVIKEEILVRVGPDQ